MSDYNLRNQHSYQLFVQNLNEASGAKERKAAERIQRLNEEKSSIDQLTRKIAEEDEIRMNRKAAIRNEQYREYANYLKQKQDENPFHKKKDNLSIKIGDENRQIHKQNYEESNNKLCLNPMTINWNRDQYRQSYSEPGRQMQQTGHNHEYDIINGFAFNDAQRLGPSPVNTQPNLNSNSQDVRKIDNEYQQMLMQMEREKRDQRSNIDSYGQIGYMDNLPPRKQQQMQGPPQQHPQWQTLENYDQHYNQNQNYQPQQQMQREIPSNRDKISDEEYKQYSEYMNMVKNYERPSFEQHSPRSGYPQNEVNKSDTYAEFLREQQLMSRAQLDQNRKEEIQSSQIHKMSLAEEARSEYLANKNRNTSSFDSINNSKPIINPPTPKYDISQISSINKIDKQKQYKEYLDSQIKAKSIYQNTLQALNDTSPQSNDNPYKDMREKNSKYKEIPLNPYNNKNYNFGVSSLNSNPITNPVSSYKFNDNRVPSGTLRNLGSNIMGK